MRRTLVQQISNFPIAFQKFCEKRLWGVLVGFSLLYLLITGVIASKRMLWNDELFTLYISRLGNLPEILAVLSTGADQNPPSFYWLTHWVLEWLGETPLAIRLPEIAGVLLMSLCLFRFIAKRLSALYGFAAMIFPLITIAYEYAYEARPYGLVLGFSGLALLCWQEATEKQHRRWWLFGLAGSGAAATFSHYYAIFLLIPLGLGEAMRTFLRQRVDWPIWVSFGGIMAPLALFFPIIQEARGYSYHFWAHPEWHLIPGFYYTLTIPAIGPIVAAFVVYSFWPESEELKPKLPTGYVLEFPWHEISAAIGFIIIPVAAVSLGKLVIGAFTYRYALPAVIGFSILLAIAIRRIDGQQAIMGSFFTLFLCGWFGMAGLIQFRHQSVNVTNWSNTYEFLRSGAGSTLPIVAADLHTFMTLTYYAPPGISSRMVYLVDPKASLRFLGHDTLDRGMVDLKEWFPVAIEQYEDYLTSHPQFLVYLQVQGERSWLGFYWGRPWEWSWLLYALPSAPVQIELVNRHEDGLLFLVTSPEKK